MDFQNRAGSKPGSGGVAGASESNVDRRERLRRLALETIDISKDPYFMKNHLGSYECKLCLTLHTNEGSYLAHTQGRKHQTNLARRAAREARENVFRPEFATKGPAVVSVPKTGAAGGSQLQQAQMVPKKNVIKIGRPGYKVTKLRDPRTRQSGLLFQIDYPEIAMGVIPRYRFMGAYEQKVEQPDRTRQYLLVAAEPYETIAFKLQAKEIDRAEGRLQQYWDPDAKAYALQIIYR